jgi:hypothetical protein
MDICCVDIIRRCSKDRQEILCIETTHPCWPQQMEDTDISLWTDHFPLSHGNGGGAFLCLSYLRRVSSTVGRSSYRWSLRSAATLIEFTAVAFECVRQVLIDVAVLHPYPHQYHVSSP